MAGKKTTIKEIAEKTGVSIGTVHRAIYGKEGVGEETRKRILAEVEKMNYKVDEVASSLKRKELRIAVVLPKACGEERFFFRGIWEGIKKASDNLEKYKVQFTYIESEYNLNEISLELKRLFDTELDEINGLITLSDDKESNEWISRFYHQGVTVVLLASYGKTENVFSSIKVNHQKAGELAAEFIQKMLGGRKGEIMLLTGNRGAYTNQNYGNAFIDYLNKCEISNPLIKVDGFGRKEIEQQCRDLLESENIVAIFCCNARNTYVLCEILDEYPKRDIIFLGTDVFSELKPYLDKGILTAVISQMNFEQGERAVNVLYQYLTTGSRDKKTEEMPVSIVMKSNYEYYMH